MRAGDLSAGATVEDDLVAFQVMDQQGNLRFVENLLSDGLELVLRRNPGSKGIRQRFYPKTTTCNSFCSVAVDENTLEWTEIPLNHDLVAMVFRNRGIIQGWHRLRAARWRTVSVIISRAVEMGQETCQFSTTSDGYHQFLDPRQRKVDSRHPKVGVSDCAEARDLYTDLRRSVSRRNRRPTDNVSFTQSPSTRTCRGSIVLRDM